MRKKTSVYFWLGIGTSIILGLFFSIMEYCFSGHDAFCLVHLSEGLPYPWPMIFFGLPGGIISGFIGNFINIKFAKTTPHAIGFGLLTVILSFFLSGNLIIWLWE